MDKLTSFFRTYYGDPDVRGLIAGQFRDREFAIGSSPELSRRGWSFPVRIVPGSRVFELVDSGLDIFMPLRSADDGHLLVIWDLEYFNNDSNQYLYEGNGVNQKLVFSWMEPIILTITEVLNSFGIKYLIDTTASGFHVWSKISAGSDTFSKFAAEGHLEESLMQKYDMAVPGDIKRERKTPESLGLAYNTVGKILEYFTHTVAKKLRLEHSPLPVTVSDTSQGGACFPRAGFSSDLTQYAHPFYMRGIRTIGSMHQKIRKYFPGSTPAIDVMRVPGMQWDEILDTMWDARRAAQFYRGKDTSVPVSDEGWMNALASYKRSRLRKWHREFEGMPLTKIKTHAFMHPPCIQQNVFWENAHISLLKPSYLQLIAEYYTATGENIKSIAVSIARKYADPRYGWYDPAAMTGIDWTKYDPYTAANFWMRVYSGLYRAGLGRGLNCETVRSAGICPINNCGRELSKIVPPSRGTRRK